MFNSTKYFINVVEDHKCDVDYLLQLREAASRTYVCKEGFILYIEEDDYDLIISAAIDDKYTRGMWRTLQHMIVNRPRDLYIEYVRNYDILYKMSKKYGGIKHTDTIVKFPKEVIWKYII